LKEEKINASFFFTGDFYENGSFKTLINQLSLNRNYLGPHSDKHLLYCDWKKRDSLLVSVFDFSYDLLVNITKIDEFNLGAHTPQPKFFLPPYEWYNDTIAKWTADLGMQLINYTPGTLSHADYTTIKDKNYRNSETIFNSIMNYEKQKPAGLNGFILLMHIGTGPDREDKFYKYLPRLIRELKAKGYHFQRIDELLKAK